MKINITSKTNLSKYQSNKPVFLWDKKLTGFGIKVNPSGKHAYIVQYRDYTTQKQRRQSLGLVAQSDLKDVKQEAKKLVAERFVTEKMSSLPLRTLLSDYINDRQLKESTTDDMESVIKRFFKMDLCITTFTKDFIHKWYISKTNQKRPTSTDRCYRYLKALFNYAKVRGLVSENPFDIIKDLKIRYKAVAKDNYLDESEILSYWKALNDSKAPQLSIDMIRLYLLTGMRRGELYKARIDNGFIHIPNTKNGSDHLIPINEYIKPYLYLLSIDKPKDIRTSLYNISDVIGKAPAITLHDLRRSAASLMAHLGIDSMLISRALNHSLSGVTERHYIQRKASDTAPCFEVIGAYLTK